MTIRADTAEEARVFALAAIQGLQGPFVDEVLARVAVVDSLDATEWATNRRVIRPTVLVAGTSSPETFLSHASEHVRVILPLGREEPQLQGPLIDIEEPLPWRDAVDPCLQDLGIPPEQALRIARESGGRIRELRRQLGLPERPTWYSEADHNSLLVMALVGAWVPRNDVDCSVVQKFGVDSAQLETVCQRLTKQSEAPIEHVDGIWKWKAHASAVRRLIDYFQGTILTHFTEVAIEILGCDDPYMSLPRDERWSAHLRPKPGPSTALKKGVIATVGCLGTSSAPRDQNRSERERAAGYIVQHVLTPGCERWATLANYLPTLAEAAPSDFLVQVERSIDAGDVGLSRIFDQEELTISGSPPHVPLLWALETIAWHERYMSGVGRALAFLADADPGGRLSNRPAASLCALFHLGTPQTTVPDDERGATLARLVEEFPTVGWNLLHSLVDSLEGILPQSRRPTLLQWPNIPREPKMPTYGEMGKRISLTYALLLKAAGNKGKCWASLIKIRLDQRVDSQLASQLLEEVRRRRDTLEDLELVRAALRAEVHLMYDMANHRAPEDTLEAFEEALRDLDSDDPVERFGWRFNHGNLLPEPHGTDFAASEVLANVRRDEALQELLTGTNELDIVCLGELLRVIETPNNLAGTLARREDAEHFEELLLTEECPSGVKQLAVPFAHSRFCRRGRDHEWLGCLLVRWLNEGLSESALDLVARIWPSPQIWDLLDREPMRSALRLGYWSRLELVGNLESDDHWDRAVLCLIEAGNSGVALNTAWYRQKHIKVVTLVETLSAFARHPRQAPHLSPTYSLERVFLAIDKRLENGEFPENLLKRLVALEITYAPLMTHMLRKMTYVARVLEAKSEEFVTLVSWLYSDQREEHPTSSSDDSLAKQAYHTLSSWKEYPGHDCASNEQREENLLDWAKAALEQTNEIGRVSGGQCEVARVLARVPSGEDGHWPCLAARELLASRQYHLLSKMLRTAKYNIDHSRAREAWSGIAKDKASAESFESSSRALRARWPDTARLLEDLAETYRSSSTGSEEHLKRERIAEGYSPDSVDT